jgi:hypothetical protein
MIFDNAGRRMCPCGCGQTFDEAVEGLVADGDTREGAVKFLEDWENGE